MNTNRTEPRQHRLAMAGIAAIALTGVTLALPSAATADQMIPPGGEARASADTLDIADHVYQRKVAMAQDRVDRAFLHQ